jgi:outer membrane receptor protein involved in Fe transport
MTLFPGLVLTLGARWDYQDRDSLVASSQFNPKAGVVYRPSAGTAVRASVGRGFRTPSVAEAFIVAQVGGVDIIPNPALRPERSVSLEAGINQLIGQAAIVDVALFQSEYRELIESGFVIVDGVLKGQFNNVTRARVQGVEVSARAAFFERDLLLDAGYTYVYPRDLDLQDILKYRPRHVLYAGATGRLGLLTLGADFRYLSRVEKIDEELALFINDADARVAIVTVDARCAADISLAGAPASVSLLVNNILQYNSVELAGILSPPRTYSVSLECRF